MHCLIVIILCCIDDHFTNFVAVLLLLTMVSSFVVSYMQYLGKRAYHVYRIGYRYRFLFGNEYRISEKH